MSKSRKRRSRRAVLSVDHSAGRIILPRARVELDETLRWYALWCQPNRERRAEEALVKAGIAGYRPLETRRIVHRGRIVEAERAPVGRYLFAGLDGDQQFWDVRRALETPLDRPLAVLIRTERGPLLIPTGLLQAFEDAVSLYGEPVQARSRFQAGQVARITSGPFLGLLTRLEAVSDDRIRGLVGLFGRKTLVEFEPEQLEEIGEEPARDSPRRKRRYAPLAA